MLEGYIFLPDQIDLASTVIWGVVTTAIGGVIAGAILGSVSLDRVIESVIVIFIIGAAVWLGYYNLPPYGLVFLGDRQKNCDQGMSFWYKAKEIQPKIGLAYLRIGNCFLKAGDYDTAIALFNTGKIYEPKGQILTALGKCYLGTLDFA